MKYLVGNNVQKNMLAADSGLDDIAAQHFGGDMAMVERIAIDTTVLLSSATLDMWERYYDHPI